MIIYQGLKRLSWSVPRMLGWNAVLEAANGLECQNRTDRPESWDFSAVFFSEPARELF